MAMHQLHLVARLERHLAGQQFVKSDAERVKVGALVEPPVHAPGLFRRHVAQRAFQMPRSGGALLFGRQFAGHAKIDQLQHARIGIPDQVGRIDVLVDHALQVDRFERRAQLQRDVEEIVQRQRALRRRLARRQLRAQHLVKRLAARVFLDHGPAPAMLPQRQRLHHARMAAAARAGILALEVRHLLKRWKLLIRHLDDQRGAVKRPGAPDQRARPAMELFDDLVVKKGAHGLGLRCGMMA